MNKLINIIAVLVLAFFAYMLFVMLPILIYADSECLSQGYPKAHVTFDLKRYCSNLGGAVVVRVVKQ